MIDTINITGVQKIEISAPRHAPSLTRSHWKSPRRTLTITYGDGEITVIELSSDGDDIPVWIFDGEGIRNLVTED